MVGGLLVVSIFLAEFSVVVSSFYCFTWEKLDFIEDLATRAICLIWGDGFLAGFSYFFYPPCGHLQFHMAFFRVNFFPKSIARQFTKAS